MSKRLSLNCLLLGLVFFVAGCGASHEKAFEAYDRGKYNQALKTFKDEGATYNWLIGKYFDRAEAEDMEAQYFIGYVYMDRARRDLRQAKQKARHVLLLRKNKMLGARVANGMIAETLKKGKELFLVDIRNAYRWFAIAAEPGHLPARTGVGVSLLSMPERDNAEAVDWFRQAADQGDAAARNNLAVMYYYGDDVPRDVAKAGVLFSMAKKQGNTCAVRNLAKLKDKSREGLKVSQTTDISLSLSLHRSCFGTLKPRSKSPRL